MKVFVAEFEDYTISGHSGILGIYDNFKDAQKRADDFSKHFIRSDAKGPLGKAEVIAYDMNQALPGCAAEACEMEEMNKEE